jgi:hypothetical protein
MYSLISFALVFSAWISLTHSAMTTTEIFRAQNIEPSKARAFGQIDIYDVMTIRCRFMILNWQDQWTNVFSVGSASNKRLPALYLPASSATSGAATGAGFHLSWSTVNNWNPFMNLGGTLALNTGYTLVIEITQSTYKVTLNGVAVYDGPYDPHNLETSQTVYMGNPSYTSARVRIYYLVIEETHDPNCACATAAEVVAPPDMQLLSIAFLCGAIVCATVFWMVQHCAGKRGKVLSHEYDSVNTTIMSAATTTGADTGRETQATQE